MAVGSDTDGDYSTLNVNASGRLYTSATVDTALPAGTNNIGDVDILSIAAGDNNIGNMDIVTMPNVTLAAGTNTNEVVGDAAHDAAAAGNPVLIGAYASAAAPTAVSLDGDAVRVWADLNGRVQIGDGGGSLTVDGTVTANLAAGTNNIGDVDILSIAAGDNNIGNVDVVTLPNVTLAAGTNTNEVVGDVAHDIAAAGNPVLIAGRATNSIEGLTQVQAADSSYITTDLNGCIVTRPHTTLEEIITERIADTSGTSTAFTNFGLGGAGIRNYVTSITIWNSSATDGYVDIRDGAAGAVLATIPAPQTGGAHIVFPVPLRSTANTALAYDVSGAITTVYITMVGFQARG